MKILNLYSGLGGNRKLWTGVEVVSVEINQDIANIYHDLFPKDEIVVGDAHEYLLDNFQNFDFIWSSPPCQTHSSFRQNLQVRLRGVKPVYPDMKLYQEIIFLMHNCSSLWVVENVKPYYRPLIEPSTSLARHAIWSNFDIYKRDFTRPPLRSSTIGELQHAYGVDLTKYKIPNKIQILRNCVLPELGLHVLNEARRENLSRA